MVLPQGLLQLLPLLPLLLVYVAVYVLPKIRQLLTVLGRRVAISAFDGYTFSHHIVTFADSVVAELINSAASVATCSFLPLFLGVLWLETGFHLCAGSALDDIFLFCGLVEGDSEIAGRLGFGGGGGEVDVRVGPSAVLEVAGLVLLLRLEDDRRVGVVPLVLVLITVIAIIVIAIADIADIVIIVVVAGGDLSLVEGLGVEVVVNLSLGLWLSGFLVGVAVGSVALLVVIVSIAVGVWLVGVLRVLALGWNCELDLLTVLLGLVTLVIMIVLMVLITLMVLVVLVAGMDRILHSLVVRNVVDRLSALLILLRMLIVVVLADWLDRRRHHHRRLLMVKHSIILPPGRCRHKSVLSFSLAALFLLEHRLKPVGNHRIVHPKPISTFTWHSPAPLLWPLRTASPSLPFSARSTTYLTPNIHKTGLRLALPISIIPHQKHQPLHHIFLPAVPLRTLTVGIGVIDAEIGVDPYLDIPLHVHAHLSLLNSEVLRMFVYPRVPFQRLHQQV